MIRFIIILLVIFTNLNSFNAQEKYWIYLNDKYGSLDDSETYLSKKAIERRLKIGYPIGHYTDLPVSQNYISEIETQVIEIKASSRWINAICVLAHKNQINSIAKLPYIKDIKGAYLKQNYCSVEDVKKINDLLERQTLHLKGNSFIDNGFTGKGIRICIIDGGFKGARETSSLKHLYDNNQIIKTWDFHYKKEDVYKFSNHGTGVMSCIAGKEGDQLMGLAQGADFLLARTERIAVENQSEEELWLLAAEWADANGADIINTSLGYTADEYFPYQMDGTTSIIAKAANLAARKGILVVCSAGNSGTSEWKYIATPADADSVLTVGAITGSFVHRNFSSYGPTSDQRMKPNVVAYGDVMVGNSQGIKKAQGTSFSSPLIAGFAACLWEKFKDSSNMQIFKMIEKSSTLFPYFDYAHGYGVPQGTYFFNNRKEESTFKIINSENKIQIGLNENAFSENTMQYLFMHVANENNFLEHYETIIVYKRKPYDIIKEKYKGKKLRFHFKGFTDEIQL